MYSEIFAVPVADDETEAGPCKFYQEAERYTGWKGCSACNSVCSGDEKNPRTCQIYLNNC